MLSFIHSMKNEYGETVAKGIQIHRFKEEN